MTTEKVVYPGAHLRAVKSLDLHLRWGKHDGARYDGGPHWRVECRAAKALGDGESIAEAAESAWSGLAAYAAALEAMPDKALKAPALRERTILRALRAALTELGADLTK